MTKRYIQDPDTHKLVPAEDYRPKRAPKAPVVWADIEEYVPMAGPEAEAWVRGDKDRKKITSRSRHREYLRRNNLVEVGNEFEAMTKYRGRTRENHDYFSQRQYKGERVDPSQAKFSWQQPHLEK